MSFSYEFSTTKDGTGVLKLQGFLDESADLPEISEFPSGDKIIFDFGGVDLINSSGIKKWVRFVDEIDDRVKSEISFHNCHRILVDQINLIEGFLPQNSKVESVFVPLYCEECESEFEVLQRVEKIDEDIDRLADKVTESNCGNFPQCRKKFDLDFVPERFFRFAKK